jgi:hypothetical protein
MLWWGAVFALPPYAHGTHPCKEILYNMADCADPKTAVTLEPKKRGVARGFHAHHVPRHATLQLLLASKDSIAGRRRRDAGGM